MPGLKYHSCPRCKKGDIAMEKDYYGCYEFCVQCGYAKDLDSMNEPVRQQTVATARPGKSVKIAVGKK